MIDHLKRLGVTAVELMPVHEFITALSQTLERADHALYQAKHTGRDRFVTAPPAKP